MVVFCTKKDITIDKINLAFQNFSKKNKILETTKEKLVSIDFNHSAMSSTFDATQTRVMGNLVKVVSWYDNEWGYSNRVVDLVSLLGQVG